MHQLRNREVNKKHLLIIVTWVILKSSIYNEWNKCIFMSDVTLLYTSLPSSPHTLCTMLDHKRLSIFGVDYPGQESGHLCTTPWRGMGDCTETWTHTPHTHKAREFTSYFTIFKILCIFWPSGETKCHEKLIKHYISKTETVLIHWLFSWVRQAMLVTASDPQMCNQTKKSKGLRLR